MTVGEATRFAPATWRLRRGGLALDRARVMAILNVTPDSFFDGGRLHDAGAAAVGVAVEHAVACVRAGADLLDIGGESTRPGADPVEPDEETARVVPVITALSRDPRVATVPLSVDTRRASVAAAALAAGASIVNDISGLADPAMAAVVAEHDAALVVGHLRGQPETMQRSIRFVDVLREVTDELAATVERAVAAGIDRARILVDPGIGFGKTAEQSAALVAASGWLRQATGCPVLIGASRKSFMGVLAGTTAAIDATGRLPGSLAAAVIAAERGASVLRVHDVADTVQALLVARSIRSAYEAAQRGEEAGLRS